MCSDLDSSSGSGIEIHGTSDGIFTCQSSICRFITAARDRPVCDHAVQPSGTSRAELTTLINNIFDGACKRTAGYTVHDNCTNCHFSFSALIACLTVDQACQKLSIAGRSGACGSIRCGRASGVVLIRRIVIGTTVGIGTSVIVAGVLVGASVV